MSLIRLIFLAILAYLGIKIFSGLFKSSSRPHVTGKAENKPIDLSKEDVEDVDYEENKEK
jgi:hypothetical protein